MPPRHRHLVLSLVTLIGLGLVFVRAPGHAAAPELNPLGLGSAFEPGRIMRGDTPHRILHFTFDDGPEQRTTPRLLDELDTAGIKATFFFSASRFAERSERNANARALAREVYDRGHGIGSHSMDHKRMKSMNREQLRAQLAGSDRLFTEIFGRRTFLFRPPWGSHSPELDRMFVERKDTMVLWNIGSNDWSIYDARQLETTFMRALPFLQRTKGWGGGIVLMHDTHPWTVEAFPKIIAQLRARNCQLLTTDEELYDIHDDLSAWRAPRDDQDRSALEAELARRQLELRAQTKIRCAAAR